MSQEVDRVELTNFRIYVYVSLFTLNVNEYSKCNITDFRDYTVCYRRPRYVFW